MMTKFYTSAERHFDDILYVGYHNGRREVRKFKFRPTLYVQSQKPTKYRTLDNIYVDSIEPGKMSECNAFIRDYTASNFKIYGNTDYISQFLAESFPNNCQADPTLINITFIDIEVQSDQGFPEVKEAALPVTAITIKNNLDDTFYTWGYGDFDCSKSIIQDKRIEYVKCRDEETLLMKFLTHWQKNVPDIISGWNSEGFDIPYLINRIERVLGSDQLRKLSLFNIVPQKTDTKETYNILGSTQLDFMALFKKFGYTYGNQESYKLDNIANVVLGEKKLDYSEYSSLHALFKENHQKFIDYNIRDTQLVERMNDKTGLISLALTIAHKANSTYITTFGSVRIWDTFIYNFLKRKNIAMSPQKEIVNDRSIEGAYVKDPQVGMHKWVCSFDLNSLYPHLIMQYNMSPETIVDEIMPGANVETLLNRTKFDIPKNRCLSGTGQMFSNEKYGVFAEIVSNMYDERAVIKKKAIAAKQKLENIDKKEIHTRFLIEKEISHYDNQQMALKILLNSLYGAMSNKWFRYYDIRMAEAITISGQLSIRWAERAINNYLNNVLKTNKDYVLAIDTDSVYVKMEDLVKKVIPEETDQNKICSFLDKVSSQKFEPLLNNSYEDLKNLVQAYEQKMYMKREIIASKIIFTGKKRYIANVLNNEGVQYNEPKIKITGIESVRSSTPQVCRKLIEETLKIIMNGDESAVQTFIYNSREKFNKLPVEDVSFPRGVKELNKKYREGIGTPIHVRSSRSYNKLLRDKKLTNKYEEIKDGEKIKFTYLKTPNPIGENVIAFNSVFPIEFNLNRYVDYNMQFQKSYVDPIKTILDSIGWSTEKQNTLEDFFN